MKKQLQDFQTIPKFGEEKREHHFALPELLNAKNCLFNFELFILIFLNNLEKPFKIQTSLTS